MQTEMLLRFASASPLSSLERMPILLLQLSNIRSKEPIRRRWLVQTSIEPAEKMAGTDNNVQV